MATGFVDTNVLIYAATGVEHEPIKWARAHELLRGGPFALSGQVLAEFYNVATVKHRLAISEVERWLMLLESFACQPIDRSVVLAGVALSRRYQISYWDAALIAAAKRLRLETLYTEDLNHGQTYDGVRVINPLLD